MVNKRRTGKSKQQLAFITPETSCTFKTDTPCTSQAETSFTSIGSENYDPNDRNIHGVTSIDSDTHNRFLVAVNTAGLVTVWNIENYAYELPEKHDPEGELLH